MPILLGIVLLLIIGYIFKKNQKKILEIIITVVILIFIIGLIGTGIITIFMATLPFSLIIAIILLIGIITSIKNKFKQNN